MKKIFTFGILMLFIVLAAGRVFAAEPVLATIGDKDAFEDTKLEFTVTATGNTSQTLNLYITGLPSTAFGNQVINDDITTKVRTISRPFSWTPDDLGEHEINFTVKDETNYGSNPPAHALSVTETITITVFPQLCEDGEVGDDLAISDLDLDEDEYFVGDDITLDVDVDNDGTKDLDVNVEAFLYDVNEEDKIDEFDSDTTEIRDTDTENFEVDLRFPFDNDLNEDGDFFIFVKAYEDGDEDKNCVQDKIRVDLERDDADVVIEDLTINPSTAEPGQTVEITADILNVGTDDMDDVTVEVVNTQLGISQKSNAFDIERAGDDDSVTERFTIMIPANAQARDYSFTVRVLDEDSDVFDRGEEFVTLTVIGQPKPTTELELSQTSFNVDAGDSLTLPVTVRNIGGSTGIFVLTITPAGSWASEVTQVVSVPANSEQIVNVLLSIKSDTSSGAYTALVSLKSGSDTVQSGSVTVNVENPGLGGVTGGTVYTPRASSTTISTVFWVIADIALVVVIIYFITLLFRRRRK